jgi:glutamate synthase (NADPH/NADH) large chain
VSKAKADVVLISGHDGGTGASPLTSLKHAGAPWELGLGRDAADAAAQRLRDRIVVQIRRQLEDRSRRSDRRAARRREFGFATAPLVVERAAS